MIAAHHPEDQADELVAAAWSPGQTKEGTVDKKWMWLGVAFLAGVVLSGRVRTLPLGNKIPTL